MEYPHVRFVRPKFTLHPDSQPPALPPPARERSFRAPFGIDPWLFDVALRPEVPLLFALGYIITVFSLNAFNRSRQWKPWWIARQWWFNWFVVLHNAILTVYSAATFAAICHAAAATLPNFFASTTTLASVADALCKMNGPRGFGDALTYNTTINIWESKNFLIRTDYAGQPDSTDVGRLWNEGLAFWGWLFYISKFYEVIDTGIILAKGKRSATLQTYHHSGAMLCMWAGIRYMSPPIWMFVFMNSFIHALMYTYFTLSALGIKVPQRLKRSLTSLQIFQFIWGATFASIHLFIQYDMPVSTPYQVASTIKAAVASVGSAAAAASSGASRILESPAADGTLAATLKKLLLRAAGEEGIAELVGYQKSEPILAQVENKIEQTKTIFETRWRSDLTSVNCIDTSGQIFAIYLNLFYLAPLTFLFARFFVKAYTRWGKSSKTAGKIIQAGKEASQKTEAAVEQAGKQAEGNIQHGAKDVREETVKPALEDAQRKVEDVKEQVIKPVAGNVQQKTDDIKEEVVKPAAEAVQNKAEDIHEQIRQDVESFKSGNFSQSTRTFTSSGTTQSSSFSRSEQITSSTHFEAEDESESKQDSNLEASFETRPGLEDDTDAMGRSGAIIDNAQDADDAGGLLPPSPGRES